MPVTSQECERWYICVLGVWSVSFSTICNKPGMWAVIYLCVKGMVCVSLCEQSYICVLGVWSVSLSVSSHIFVCEGYGLFLSLYDIILYFGTVPTILYFCICHFITHWHGLIDICYWNLQILNNKSIIKTKVLLPEAYVTLADFGDPI